MLSHPANFMQVDNAKTKMCLLQHSNCLFDIVPSRKLQECGRKDKRKCVPNVLQTSQPSGQRHPILRTPGMQTKTNETMSQTVCELQNRLGNVVPSCEPQECGQKEQRNASQTFWKLQNHLGNVVPILQTPGMQTKQRGNASNCSANFGVIGCVIPSCRLEKYE